MMVGLTYKLNTAWFLNRIKTLKCVKTHKTYSGQKLCRLSEENCNGNGTYVRNGYVYASLMGYLHTDTVNDKACAVSTQEGKIKSLNDLSDVHSSWKQFPGNVRFLEPGIVVLVEVRSAKDENIVPSVGAIVTAKITNVNPRFSKCLIQNVGHTPLREPFRGMIRKEDVRATEKDKVEMYNCFRPGDIIVAKVLGDAHSYVLSTAENELGVVLATSEAGYTMIPISWCSMQCPHTLAKEHRKVAKVQQQFIEYSDKVIP